MKIKQLCIIGSISLLLSFVLLETAVRIAERINQNVRILSYNPYTLQNYDRIVDWKTLNNASECTFMKPGEVVNDFVVNSHGFLSEELPYEKPDNEYRILLLGDSYATGTIPYRYHFLPLLEKSLNSANTNVNEHIQTINLGIPCGGTTMYKKAFEVEGRLYNPNLVLLSFFIGNDFIDDVMPVANNYSALNQRLDQNTLPPKILYSGKLTTVLTNVFRVAQYTHELSESARIASAPNSGSVLGTYTETTSQYDPLAPNLKTDKFLQLEADHSTIYSSQSDVHTYWPHIKQNITDIQQLANSSDAQLVVVIFPAKIQVDEKLFSDVVQYAHLDPSLLDVTLPSRQLQAFLEEQNISYINLAPRLKQEMQHAIIYQPNDTHLNSTGNKFVSRVLFESIFQYIPQSNH